MRRSRILKDLSSCELRNVPLSCSQTELKARWFIDSFYCLRVILYKYCFFQFC